MAELITKVKKSFTKMSLRVAFVGYRDYNDPNHRFDVVDFQDDIVKWTHLIAPVAARKGDHPTLPADVPEDIVGGLQKALGLRYDVLFDVLVCAAM